MAAEGTTGARADAIELLTSQHRDVEQLWSQLQTAHRNGDQLQEDLARRIITMLSQHDAIETQLLYPAVRAVPEGDQLADHSLEEHQKVRELLKQADRGDIREDTVFLSLTEAIQAVQHHVEEEETAIFPKLRAALGAEKLMDLGTQLAAAMPMAPTHPHPSTPNNPVGAAVAGTVTGMVDKARDAFSKASGR